MTRQERRKRRRQRRRMQAAILASLLFTLALIVTLRIRETAPEPVARNSSAHSPSAARACLSKSDSARCVWDRWRWYCPKIICPFSSSTTSLTVVEPTSMPA